MSGDDRHSGNDPVNQVDPDGTEWGWRDLLDAAGFIPVVGEVADLANAVLYAAEGDWGNALISAAGALPGGDVLKAARLGRKVVQEAVESGGGQVVKQEAKNALQEQGKQALPKAYQEAVKGGRHKGILDTYKNRSTEEIKRARRGYLKQVELHRAKLANPERYADNWCNLSEREKNGLLEKWRKDAERNQELADIMRGILLERGEAP